MKHVYHQIIRGMLAVIPFSFLPPQNKYMVSWRQTVKVSALLLWKYNPLLHKTDMLSPSQASHHVCPIRYLKVYLSLLCEYRIQK